ncbi:39S ribosomal protein L52, mitochondrial isoform X2 [Ornithorhynchus anatinus]|uniref:39S ribosomal protein L52, mitochondrial isoform X2 n=1 Tax=Ornithorhynchus anatinus TaxID=9258 RepID=UPI0010A92C6C|nr:39S ribosomal protein L52, mitochondrial isoform X2 [Ornithorhynchus anatinus]
MASPIAHFRFQDGVAQSPLFRTGSLPTAVTAWRASGLCASVSEVCTAAWRSGLEASGGCNGRPAPMMKRQCNRLKKREMFARRVILLSQEMDAGMEAWKQQQEKKSEEKKQKQESRLKPKGRVGQVPLPSQ